MNCHLKDFESPTIDKLFEFKQLVENFSCNIEIILTKNTGGKGMHVTMYNNKGETTYSDFIREVLTSTDIKKLITEAKIAELLEK